MKKFISIVLTSLIIGSAITGCGNGSANSADDQGKISVVTTIFPEYDWVKEITRGNENVDITFLLSKGVDLHSFQPSAEDMIKISSCDMFIYVGGESDSWVNDALKGAVNKEMKVIKLMDILGDCLKEEEFKEGMQKEEQEEDTEEIEYDEHVWLSIKNSEKFCDEIAKGLSEIDPENSSNYDNNVKKYISKLDALDKEYEKTVDEAAKKSIIFADRFPFRYMTDDYGLDYYAAFVGCSAESEASFGTITFLSGKVDELDADIILQSESADGKIAQTVIANTVDKDQQVLTMDAMQSTTVKDIENGATYFSIMESNLQVLKQALN